MPRLCLFCASSHGARPVYTEAARATARAAVARGYGVVYGGGNVGLMGEVADAALAAGGEVIGVIPEALVARELAHGGLTQLHVVGSMHERKALMAELSDGFLALPGGYGTLEEFCEVLTWSQLGLHAKPCGLLNVEGFWDGFLRQLDHAAAERLVTPEHRALVLEDTDPARLLERMERFRAPATEKWIDKDET